MIEPFKVKNGEWLVVKNVHWQAPSRFKRGGKAFEKCWTGNSWVPQATFGQKFKSEEDARCFIDKNQEMLDP